LRKRTINVGVFESLYNRFFKSKRISVVPISPACEDWHENRCKGISPEEIYLTIPVFRSVIDYIAKSASQLPVGIYANEKPIISDYLKQPNKHQSWTEFIFDSVAKKLIYGENVIVYQKGELFNLNYDEYDYDDYGKIIVPKNGAARITPNPLDGKTSLSILTTAEKLAIRARENLDATSNMIKNGGMAGILSANLQNDFASPKLVENAEQELRTKFGGGKNYGKLAVIGYPLNYAKVGLNAQELGIIDFYKFDLIDVCRVFGVPSPLLNDTEQSTYNNMTEAEKRFYRNVIIPEMNDLCDTITRVIGDGLKLRGIPNAYLWYSLNHILALQEDLTMQIDNQLKLFNAGIITADELKANLDR
jgi:HK97 family phage portal protein